MVQATPIEVYGTYDATVRAMQHAPGSLWNCVLSGRYRGNRLPAYPALYGTEFTGQPRQHMV